MLEVRREDLIDAIRILDLVGSKPGFPSSGFFLLEPGKNGNVRATVAASAVGEVSIAGRGEWPTGRPFFTDRGVLSPWINVAKELKNKNRFQFQMKGKNLHVEHGERYEDFLPQPPVMGYARLPKFKEQPSELELSEELIEVMECASNCAASELQLPHLACLYMIPTKSGVGVYATDQKVVFAASVITDMEIDSPLPFPVPMVPVISAENVESIVWGGRCVVARFPRGKVWQTISREALTEFPIEEIQGALKRGVEEKIVFVVSAYRFAKLTARLTLYLQTIRKEDWTIRIVGREGNGGVVILVKLPHVTIRETIRTLEPVRRDFRMEWPLNMIAPVLQFVGKEEEQLPLKVGLEKDGLYSYLKCGRVRMVIPSKAM